VDFNPTDIIYFEGDFGQSSGRFGGQTTIDEIDVNPISNFTGALSNARMQTRSAQNPGFIRVKDAINVVLVEVKLTAKAAQQLYSLTHLQRFATSPGHPGAEMIEALLNGGCEQWRIRRIPAAD
jgi:hypothetical protein